MTFCGVLRELKRHWRLRRASAPCRDRLLEDAEFHILLLELGYPSLVHAPAQRRSPSQSA
jgi:hypothetical protein